MRPILPSLLAAALALSACATSAPAPEGGTVAASRSVADPSGEALRAVDATERACLAEAVYYEAGQSREGFEAVAERHGGEAGVALLVAAELASTGRACPCWHAAFWRRSV